MSIHLHWPPSARLRRYSIQFLQGMLDRMAVGEMRYERGRRRESRPTWVLRMNLELEAYMTTGNAEHLFNLANYAMREYLGPPEHPRQHHDPHVDSATRGKV